MIGERKSGTPALASTAYDTTFLRLPHGDDSGRRRLELSPTMAAFQPFALLLWKTAPGSRIHQLSVHIDRELLGAVPAMMFEADVAWSFFLARSERRPDGVETVNYREIGKFFRLSCRAMHPNDRFIIDVEGRFEHGVLLGRTPRYVLPEAEPGVMP